MTSTPLLRPIAVPRKWGAAPAPRVQTQDEGSRRALNVAVAAAGIVVTAPIMALIALAIKLTSRGPVFYIQTRVGIDRRTPGRGVTNHRRSVDYGGSLFKMYKFRTMKWQPTSKEVQVWATRTDPRITKIGRVLRQFRLDELPQLFNVLLGDMNVVGPRPEQPNIAARLRQEVPGWEMRQQVRPGITGLAQINNSYDESMDDVRRKVALDLEYLSRHSFMEDLKIMLRTAPVVALRKGGW